MNLRGTPNDFTGIVKTNIPQQPVRRIGMPNRRTAKDKLPRSVNLAAATQAGWRTCEHVLSSVLRSYNEWMYKRKSNSILQLSVEVRGRSWSFPSSPLLFLFCKLSMDTKCNTNIPNSASRAITIGSSSVRLAEMRSASNTKRGISSSFVSAYTVQATANI
jgi:hypothetical protein